LVGGGQRPTICYVTPASISSVLFGGEKSTSVVKVAVMSECGQVSDQTKIKPVAAALKVQSGTAAQWSKSQSIGGRREIGTAKGHR